MPTLEAVPPAGVAPLTTRLQWTLGHFDPADCHMKRDGAEFDVDFLSGSLALTLDVDAAFEIVCQGADHAAFSPVVDVTVSSVSDMVATPSAARPGDAVTLAWTALNLHACTVTGDSSSNDVADGADSVVVTPAVSTTYELACLAADNTPLTANVRVLVIDITNVVTPAPTIFGETASVSFDVDPAATCTVGDETLVTSDPQAGTTRTVDVAITTGDLHIHCDVDGAAAQQMDLTHEIGVLPAIDFDVTGIGTVPRQFNVEWTTQHATTCNLSDNGGVTLQSGLSGSRGIPDDFGPHDIKLHCDSADGSNEVVLHTIVDDISTLADAQKMRAIIGSIGITSKPLGTSNVSLPARFVTGDVTISNSNASQPITLSAPDLETVGGNFTLSSDANVTAFNFPALTSIGGALAISSNAALTALDFQSLGSVGSVVTDAGVTISSNDALQTMDFRVLRTMQVGGDFSVTGNDVLSCQTIHTMYCGMTSQGSPIVASNASSTCSDVELGCVND